MNICELQLIEQEKIIISSLIDNYKTEILNKQYYAKELEKNINDLIIQHKINYDIDLIYHNSNVDDCIEIDIKKIHPISKFREYIEKLYNINSKKDNFDTLEIIFSENFFSKKSVLDHIRDLENEICPLEETLMWQFIKHQEILAIVKERENIVYNLIFSIT